MSLEKISHIEGLESYANIESPDDTNPGAMQVTFRVEAEDMPFLTINNPDGTVVRKNFVRVREVINLGNLINDRRICDEVEFVDGKWKVKRLHPAQSDIRKYPEAWNAFARGCADLPAGTPLIQLFKHDPSLVARYAGYHIHSIEQLAQMTDGNCDQLFMGAKENRAQAQFFLRRLNDQAPAIAINNKLEEKDRQIELQARQLAELTAKLDELLRADIEKREESKPAKAAKKMKPQAEPTTPIEGLE